MTAEQKYHLDEYERARRRYNNAELEKRSVENRIVDLQNRRGQVIDELNQKKAEYKRYTESSDELVKTTQNDSNITTEMTNSQKKLDIAATGFLAIGENSSCKLQNLSTVFEEKNSATKTRMNDVFESLKNTKNALNQKASELLSRVNHLDTELTDNQNEERRLSNSVYEYKAAMNSSLYDMAYHKRYLQQQY